MNGWVVSDVALNNWVNPDSKNRFRINSDLLLTILGKPIPPETTEALGVLINLPPEHQAILLWEKPIGDMATNYLFGVSKGLYAAVNDLKKWKPLPTLKEVQHFLKWVDLANEVAKLLSDTSVTIDNLDADRLIEAWDPGIGLLERLNAHAQAGLELAKDVLATAKVQLTTANTRDQRVDRLITFFQNNVKLH